MPDDQTAERRRERKRARTARLACVPEHNHDFDALDLDQLRTLRADLRHEEDQVSYWRRILQARLDTITGAHTRWASPDLAPILGGAPAEHRRMAHLTVHEGDSLPPLPDLLELWTRVDVDDVLIDDLRKAEQELSMLRKALHEQIDAATAELIARYHDEPTLALLILPTREH